MEWLVVFIVAVGIIALVEWKLNAKHGFMDEIGNPFAEVIKKRIVTKKKTRKRTAKAKTPRKTTKKKTTKKKTKVKRGK